MKRLKAMVGLIVTGFFLFAPPGTLIVIALLITGWIGGVRAAIGGVLFIGALAVGWLIVRARRDRGRRARHGRRSPE